MHYPTGFYFTNKGDKRYVIYSTLYPGNRYANTFDCTGLTDEQARGKFLIDHSKMVDASIVQKKLEERKHKIILS